MTQRFTWPDTFQSAAVVTVNFHGESVDHRDLPGQALWGRSSYGRYGAQIGIQRLLTVFAKHSVRATVFIGGSDTERYPDVARAIVDGGHEIAGHGYAHEDFSHLSPEEQSAILTLSESAFQRAFGQRPAGWRAPEGLMSAATRGLLAARGYRYDSSFCDDDVPYLVTDLDDNQLAELPVFGSAGDRTYYAARRPPAIVSRAWHEELAAVHEVGGLFNLQLHPRGDYGSGRAVRIRAVDEILTTLRSTHGIWLATCAEVAEWTLTQAGTLPRYPA